MWPVHNFNTKSCSLFHLRSKILAFRISQIPDPEKAIEDCLSCLPVKVSPELFPSSRSSPWSKITPNSQKWQNCRSFYQSRRTSSQALDFQSVASIPFLPKGKQWKNNGHKVLEKNLGWSECSSKKPWM